MSRLVAFAFALLLEFTAMPSAAVTASFTPLGDLSGGNDYLPPIHI